MYEAEVVHLSETPLVSAPARVVTALNQYTKFQSVSFVGKDYPGKLKGMFIPGSIVLDSQFAEMRLKSALAKADIVHIHNNLPVNLRDLVAEYSNSRCKFVYQVHSPLGEGPLYFRRSELLGFQFSAKLTISHFPHLFEPDFHLVPNIVPYAPTCQLLEEGQKPSVLFSPSHTRTGNRWGDKVCSSLLDVLKAIEVLRLADIHQIEGVSALSLFELRRSTHVTIDEIVTGGFHQVSLEGLAAGNLVINAADAFQIAALKAICKTDEEPPFFRLFPNQISEALPALLRDSELIRKYQVLSRDFYQAHLMPEKLIKRFSDVYERILNDEKY